MGEPEKRIETKQEAKKGSCDTCGAKPVTTRDFKGHRYCRSHSMMMATRGVALEVL